MTLMTMHNAKGLEFPVVFITGLEDGLFPLAKAYDDPPLLEEERRLFYVGITRAERKLYITFAEERRRNGELMPSTPVELSRRHSRDDGRKAQHDQSASSGRSMMRAGGSDSAATATGTDRERAAVATSRSSSAARRPRLGGLARRSSDFARSAGRRVAGRAVFAIGARVKHRKFGSGTIAELAGAGRDAKVKVDFDDETIGRKTLVIAQANLERGDD